MIFTSVMYSSNPFFSIALFLILIIFFSNFSVVNSQMLTNTKLDTSHNSLNILDFMDPQTRGNGGFIVHLCIFAYSCLALMLACDSYFVPTLEIMVKKLKISEDIAGATLMAIGTSAPELFTSLISLFIITNDIGTGTIIGSAVFNIICIPAVCGIALYFWNRQLVELNSLPILRDLTFYTITIVFLIISMEDKTIDWIEASSMLLLYCLYLFILYLNLQLNKCFIEERKHLMKSTQNIFISYENDAGICNNANLQTRHCTETDIENATKEEEEVIMDTYLLKILLFPVNIIFKLTLPNPRGKAFILTFLISCTYIGLLTYIAVYMINIICITFTIPETIAGMTLLAAGTSVPELITNMIIIKKAGQVNMALSNAIGSNIFDILIGLGFPWLLRIIVNYATRNPVLVFIESNGLPLIALALLSSTLILGFILNINRWRLGLFTGIMCSVVYLIFIIFSVAIEYLV